MNRRNILLVMLFGLIVALGVTLYLFNKPHRNIAQTTADEKVVVNDWLKEFNADLEGTHQRYHNKVIELQGVVERVEESDSSTWEIGFNAQEASFELSCSIESNEKNIPALRQNVTLRCLYVGYVSPTPEFDLPGEIKCRSCVWVK